MSHLNATPQRPLLVVLTSVMLCLSSLLCGCSNSKLVDGYRPDETAQLTLMLRQVIDKLKAEDFIGLYRAYAGSRFQQHLPERTFLRRAQCVDKTFGQLQAAPSVLPAFTRSEHPTLGVTDHVTIGLNYTYGPLKVDIIVVPYGDTFKFWDFTWKTKYPQTPQARALTQCLAKVG
ncbi:MAG: hypothetical protein VKK59_03160 [Vampirovibrionales bacterium]|nr:hypothetical protein [Vampirovibrionales bacterium]